MYIQRTRVLKIKKKTTKKKKLNRKTEIKLKKFPRKNTKKIENKTKKCFLIPHKGPNIANRNSNWNSKQKK